MFSLKSFLNKSFSVDSFKRVGIALASLGGWGGKPLEEPKKKRKKKQAEEIQEALPPVVVSRIKDEMMAASLTQDAIDRAKQAAKVKRLRADEEALLLII